jgi:hypothetical protein
MFLFYLGKKFIKEKLLKNGLRLQKLPGQGFKTLRIFHGWMILEIGIYEVLKKDFVK